MKVVNNKIQIVKILISYLNMITALVINFMTKKKGLSSKRTVPFSPAP